MATRVFNFASSSLLVEKLKNFFPEMGTSESEVKQAMTKVLKTYLKGFGLNLKKIRTKKGINQVPFAKQLGVSQTTYSSWETGSHVPRLSKISMISELLGIDVGELFDEISNPTQKQYLMEFLSQLTDFFEKQGYEAYPSLNTLNLNDFGIVIVNQQKREAHVVGNSISEPRILKQFKEKGCTNFYEMSKNNK